MVLHWLPTSNNYRMSISISATPTYFTQICAIWVCQPKLCPGFLPNTKSFLFYMLRCVVVFPSNPFFSLSLTHTPKRKCLIFQPDTHPGPSYKTTWKLCTRETSVVSRGGGINAFVGHYACLNHLQRT